MKRWLTSFVIGKFLASILGGMAVVVLASVFRMWRHGAQHPVFRAISFVRKSRRAQAVIAAAIAAVAIEAMGGSTLVLLDGAWTLVLVAFHAGIVVIFSNLPTIMMSAAAGAMLLWWWRAKRRPRGKTAT